ncbi:MAG: HEAT repeat domain-containing protein [Candidatus Lokiarchaeia archaeon]
MEPLIQALQDEDKHVRREAVEALGQIKDERVVEPLKQAQKDIDELVRKYAAKALESYNTLR